MAIRFSLTELLDEQESYNFLLKTLHPDGLKCKHGHPLPPDQQPHDRRRDPICDYRCRICGNKPFHRHDLATNPLRLPEDRADYAWGGSRHPHPAIGG